MMVGRRAEVGGSHQRRMVPSVKLKIPRREGGTEFPPPLREISRRTGKAAILAETNICLFFGY